MTVVNLTLFRWIIYNRAPLYTLLFIFSFHFPKYSYGDFKLEKDPRFARSRTLAQESLKSFPPNEYMILGLGRTAGLTSEWLRQLSDRDDYVVEMPMERLKTIHILSPEQRREVFRRLIPSLQTLKGRHLVIHRVLWQSTTLSSIVNELMNYLKSEGYPFPLYFDLISSYSSKNMPFLSFVTNSNWKDQIQIRLVVDKKYQDPFTDELDRDTIEKGMTLIGKHEAITPKDFLEPNFTLKDNPHYTHLKKMVKNQICISKYSEMIMNTLKNIGLSP